MANFDIYDDLEVLHLQEKQKAAEDLQWKEKYEIALETIGKLQHENKGLNKKIKQLEQNFTSLLETARSEIKRKDNQIAELRKEKDNICFRRNVRTGNNPFSANSGGEGSRRDGGNSDQLATTNSAIAVFGPVYDQTKASTSRQGHPETNCSKFGYRAKFATRDDDPKVDRTSNHGPSDNDRRSSKAKSSDSNHERNDTKQNKYFLHRIDYKTKNEDGKEKHHRDKSDMYNEQIKDVHKVPIPTFDKSEICSKERTSFVERKETVDKRKIVSMEEDILKDVKELKKKKKSKAEGEPIPKVDVIEEKNSTTFLDALFDDMLLKNETETNDLASSEVTVPCLDFGRHENGLNKMIARTDENCNLEMQLRTPLKQNVDMLFDELFGPSPAPSMTIGVERKKSSSSIDESVSDYSEIIPVSLVDGRIMKCNHIDKGTVEEDSSLIDDTRQVKCTQNNPDLNNIDRNSDPEKLQIQDSNSNVSQDSDGIYVINCKGVQSDVESPLFEALDSQSKCKEGSLNANIPREPYASLKVRPKKEDKVTTARDKRDSFDSKGTANIDIESCVISVSKHRSQHLEKELPKNKNSTHKSDKNEEIIKKDSHHLSKQHHHLSKYHKISSSSKQKLSSKDSHRTERPLGATKELHHLHHQPTCAINENCEKTKISSCSLGKRKSSKEDRHRLSRIMKEKGEIQLEKCGSVSSRLKDQKEDVSLVVGQPCFEEENSTDLKLFPDQSSSLYCDDISDEDGIEVIGDSYPKEDQQDDVCLKNNQVGINLYDEQKEVGVGGTIADLKKSVSSITSQNDGQPCIDAGVSYSDCNSTGVALSKLNGLPSKQEVETAPDGFCYSQTTALPVNKKTDIEEKEKNADLSSEDVQLSNPATSYENKSLDFNISMDTKGIVNDSVHNHVVELKSDSNITICKETCNPTNDNEEITDRFLSIVETNCKESICKTTDSSLMHSLHSTSAAKTLANLSIRALDDTSKERVEITMNIVESHPDNFERFSEDRINPIAAVKRMDMISSEPVTDIIDKITNDDRTVPHIHSSPSDVSKVAAQKSESGDCKEDSVLSSRRRKLKTPRKFSDEENKFNDSATSNLRVQLTTKSGKIQTESTTSLITGAEYLKSPSILTTQTESHCSVQTENFRETEWNSNDSTIASIAPLTTRNDHTKSQTIRETNSESTNFVETQNVFETEKSSNDLASTSTVPHTTVPPQTKSPSIRKTQAESSRSRQTQNVFDEERNSNDLGTYSTVLLKTDKKQTKSPINSQTQAELTSSRQTQNVFDEERNSSDPVTTIIGKKQTKLSSILKTQKESTNSDRNEHKSLSGILNTKAESTNSGQTHDLFEAERNSNDLDNTSTVLLTTNNEQTKSPSNSQTQAKLTNCKRIQNLFDEESNSSDPNTAIVGKKHTTLSSIPKNHTESTNSDRNNHKTLPSIHKTQAKSNNSYKLFEPEDNSNDLATTSKVLQTTDNEQTKSPSNSKTQVELTSSGETQILFETEKKPERTVIGPAMVEVEHTNFHNARTESLQVGQTQKAVEDNSQPYNPRKSLNLSNNDGETLSDICSGTKSEKSLQTQVFAGQKYIGNTIFTADSSKSNVSCEFIKENPSLSKSDGKIHHKKRFLQHTAPYYTKKTLAQDSNEPTSIPDTVINKQKRLACKSDPGLDDINAYTTNDLQMTDIQQANTFVQGIDTRNGEVGVTIKKQNRSKTNHLEHDGFNNPPISGPSKNDIYSVKSTSPNSKETLTIETTSPTKTMLLESPSSSSLSNDSVGITTNRIENSSKKYKKRILQHFTDSYTTVAINLSNSQANDQEKPKSTAVQVTKCDIKRKRTVPKITKIVSNKIKEQHDGQSEMQVQGSVENKKKPADSKAKSSKPETLALDSCRSLIVSVAKVKFPINKNGKLEDILKVTPSSPPVIESSSLYAHDVCARSKTTTDNQKLSSHDSTCKTDKDPQPYASNGQNKVKSSTRTKRRRKVSTSSINTANEIEEISCSNPKKSRKLQNDERSTTTCDTESPSNYKPEHEHPLPKEHTRPSTGTDSSFRTTLATPTHHQIFSNDVFPEDYQNSLPLVYNSDGDDVQYTELDNRMRSMFQSPSYVNANEGCSYEAGNNTSIEMDGDTFKGNIAIDETLPQSEKSQCDTSSSSRKISVGSNDYIIETVGALTANVFITRKKSKKHVKIPQVTV